MWGFERAIPAGLGMDTEGIQNMWEKYPTDVVA